MTHQKGLQAAVVWLYWQGYAEKEIVSLRREISQRHRLGKTWLNLPQSTVNRWLKAARDADSDLEIWHLLNRRRWKPGIYTNWKVEGQIILMAFYDPLRDQVFLGAGDAFIPLDPSGDLETTMLPEVIEQEKQWRQQREADLQRLSPPIPVLLKYRFGYSYRDIARLSQRKRSRFPDRDKAPEVQQLVTHLEPMSYSTIRRTILGYDRDRIDSGVRKVTSKKVVDLFIGETVEDWSQQNEGGTS